ncbi:RNA 2',3'-cyclic phosphodiesterase [Chitinimonas sp.]|uniref:RNA 2',3'-cyclic phosphodiesterase n=1 Tax=Chitinimonas sp. TaxID=1934313 RepID=UPI0035B39076
MAERRLFLALWPDAATRQALLASQRELHGALGGRCMRAEGLHLTLAFIGDCPEPQLQALVRALSAIEGRAARLSLDRYGYWQTGIAWLGMASPPAELLALANELRRVLDATGVRYDRKPFKPHITLLRDAASGALPRRLQPLHWQSAGRFSLIESQMGRYQRLFDY